LSRFASSSRPMLRLAARQQRSQVLPASILQNKNFIQFVANFHAGAPRRSEEKAPAEAAPEPSLYDTLSEPMIAGPLMGLLAVGAIGNNLYVFNEETQLLGLFALFVGTVVTMGGETIGKAIDAQTDEILAEMNKWEDAHVESIELNIKTMEGFVQYHEDMKKVVDYQKSLIGATLDAKTLRLKHNVHENILGLLNSCAAQEDNQKTKLTRALLDDATANAMKLAQTKEVRQSSLTEALNVVSGKPSKDVAGQLFAQFFKEESTKMKANAKTVVAATPSDSKAVFQELAKLAQGDDIVNNQDAMKKLVLSFKSEPQTVEDQMRLLSKAKQ